MVDVEQLRTTMAADEATKPTGDWADKPAVPATTVAVTNDSRHTMWVEVVGGTVTVVTVDGASVGRVVGAFLLRPGSSIALTYSAAPTWKWFAL